MLSKNKNYIFKLICFVLTIATLLGLIKSVFISIDIDEAYAVAQSYRLAVGDILVKDMWEPHQFSAFLCTIFIKPYISIMGTTDYLVIYLRVIGIIIHLTLGVWLYRSVIGEFGKYLSTILFFLHVNYLPKWVQLPEFELMHYWGLLICCICIYQYSNKDNNKIIYAILTGIAFAFCVFSYPTCVFLYPIYGVYLGIYDLKNNAGKGIKKVKGFLAMTLAALIMGGSLIIYLIGFMTVPELISNLSSIFMDVSHTTYSKKEQWARYGGQFVEQLKDNWWIVVIPCLVFVILEVIGSLLKSKKTGKDWKRLFSLEVVIIIAMVFSDFVMQLMCAWGMLFADESQFYLLIRYLLIIMPATYLGLRYFSQMKKWFCLLILPSIVSMFAILFVTNMNTNVTYAKLFAGVIGSIIILYFYFKDVVSNELLKTLGVKLTYVASYGILGVLFICRIIMIRVTGCGSVTILAPMDKMEFGAEKGIYVHESYAKVWNENYEIMDKYLEEDDKLLYVGAENLVYLKANCELATPSTQGTTVFNEMFKYYYDKHPERIPNVIILDKTYRQIDAYASSYLDNYIYEWIEEEYKDANKIETQYMTIIKK